MIEGSQNPSKSTDLKMSYSTNNMTSLWNHFLYILLKNFAEKWLSKILKCKLWYILFSRLSFFLHLLLHPSQAKLHLLLSIEENKFFDLII